MVQSFVCLCLPQDNFLPYFFSRHEHPEVFECEDDGSHHISKELRQLCAVIQDYTFYFKGMCDFVWFVLLRVKMGVMLLLLIRILPNCLTLQISDTTMKEDVSCISAQHNCRFRQYEKQRLAHFSKSLQLANENWKENLKDKVPDGDKALGSEVLDKVDGIMERLLQLKTDMLAGVPSSGLWQGYCSVSDSIDEVQQLIKSFHLSPICDDILDLTDAGPGVGVSNLHVRYRDAEIARLHSSSRRNRIHRARNDSGQNEAERTNAAIGRPLNFVLK